MKFAAIALWAAVLSAEGGVDCGGMAPYECAAALLQRGDAAPAIQLLNKLVAASPRDLKALNLLGIALTGAGDVEQGSARFRQALKIDADFQPALKNLAINNFNRNLLAEAKAGLERVVGRSPGDDVAHLYLGEIAFARKKYVAAASHYDKSRGRVAQNPLAILHYGESLIHSGRVADAAGALSGLPPRDSASQFQAGLLLGGASAYREAGTHFALARVGADDPSTAAYNQTLMLIREGDHQAAIDLFSELTRGGPKRADLYNLISEAYLKTGQIEQAYDALRTATQLEPNAEDNYVDLAGISLDYENYDLGLEIVDIGLRHLPGSFRLRLHRGVMLAQKDLPEEAEAEFEKASRLSPSQSLPWAALAMTWMQRGEVARAVDMLREQVRRKPGDFMLRYVLGIALIRSGAEPETETGTEAKRAFQTSARLNAKFSRAHAELGKLLLKGGDVAGAVQELETAVKLDNRDGAAAYQLAQAYRREGKTAQAQELLARVTKLRDQKEGIDPGAEMKRIVREGAASALRTAQ